MSRSYTSLKRRNLPKFVKKYNVLFLLLAMLTLATFVVLFRITQSGFARLVFSPEESSSAAETVTVIPANRHPNLYFNTAEIENMRKAVLINKTPSSAVGVYSKIKSIAPCSKPSNMDSLEWPTSYNTARPCTIKNMQATMSYLIEPTDAKAQALRTALLSWTVKYGAYWSVDPQGGGHIQFALPFIYDAIYNSGALSPNGQIVALGGWTSKTGDRSIYLFDAATGTFTVPGWTTAVFVLPQGSVAQPDRTEAIDIEEAPAEEAPVVVDEPAEEEVVEETAVDTTGEEAEAENHEATEAVEDTPGTPWLIWLGAVGGGFLLALIIAWASRRQRRSSNHH